MSPNTGIAAAQDLAHGVRRRDVLKTAGVALAGGVLATGRVTAHGGTTTSAGDTAAVGNGSASAYTERANGALSAVGVRFDAAALEELPAAATAYHLDLPHGDAGRFEFVGVDYNPTGHDPDFLYGHEHFDFHFYMLDAEAVEAIPLESPPAYDVPDALMPAGTFTTADNPLGPAPRVAVPGMGEHLVSVPASVPAVPGDDGWSVYIWGAYDPDGDGTGQLTFMEPMITVAFLDGLRGDGTADCAATTPIPMPERFRRAGRYPTELVVRYDSHDDAFTVSLEGFEAFPGYGRR